MRKLQLIGQRFERLVVLSQEETLKKETKWLCKCDCGKETIVSGWMLNAGNTKSCGCIRLKNDRTGTKIGYWTVIEYAGSEKWLCKCRCGTEKIIPSSSFHNERSYSCGCYKSPNDHDYHERTKLRFMKKIIFNPNGCWDWTSYKDVKGYGSTTYRKQLGQHAHRVSWIIYKGNIPKGIYVLHKCDRPCCINPEHLFLGTHEDNMLDMKNKGRACKGENSHLHRNYKQETTK